MKRLVYILLLLVFLLTLSHNVRATIQARDIIIINQVEHKLNNVLLFQLDSARYNALEKELDFGNFSHSANWRGHISTFEIKDNKLFLNSIKTSKIITDFKGLLDKYIDKKGRVFASWVSGTFICGTGECLYLAQNGFDSVYTQETELIIKNGVLISSRTYFNKTNGTSYLDDANRMLTECFDISKIKCPKGRVSVKVFASKFSNEGKVTEWSVKFLREDNGLSAEMKGMIVQEINRVFNLIDWKTYCRNGQWYWIYQDGLIYPLIFE